MQFRRLVSTAAYDAAMAGFKRDLKNAMLQKQVVEKNTVKLVLSAIKDAEIDGQKQDEFALFKMLSKMHKQRVGSASDFASQKRPDLAEAEQKKAEIIERYLQRLPVALASDVQPQLRQYLMQVREQQGQVPMKQVFGMLEEKVGEWGTSVELAKPMVPGLYKEIWGK